MIRVQREDFDIGSELNHLLEGNYKVGGVCSFVGLVRDIEGEKTLQSMTLQHYPGMTEKELSKIEEEACQRWSLQESLIVHRYGRLGPGDRIVLVITASSHRQAAFESCEYVVDYLKTRAPFWKKEDYGSGSDWLKSRVSDDRAAEKWSDR